MFLLVPAYPGSPGQRAVKQLCVCVTVLVAAMKETSNERKKNISHNCCAAELGLVSVTVKKFSLRNSLQEQRGFLSVPVIFHLYYSNVVYHKTALSFRKLYVSSSLIPVDLIFPGNMLRDSVLCRLVVPVR